MIEETAAVTARVVKNDATAGADDVSPVSAVELAAMTKQQLKAYADDIGLSGAVSLRMTKTEMINAICKSEKDE